jgi:hypothetical protein
LTGLKMHITGYNYVIAGHGEIYSRTTQAQEAIGYTTARLESILSTIREELAYGESRPLGDLLAQVARRQGAEIISLRNDKKSRFHFSERDGNGISETKKDYQPLVWIIWSRALRGPGWNSVPIV